MKVVLVTGSTKGIGKRIAMEFARNKYTVILNYHIDEEAANKALGEIKGISGSAELIRCDVSKSKDVEEMFNIIKQKFNRLDALINNAGVGLNKLIFNTSEDEFLNIMNTNLKGVFLCTKEAAKIMMEQLDGSIINISSYIALSGQKGNTVYSASKSAIISFTKSTAKELGKYNIRVNVVLPGLHKTSFEVRDDYIENTLGSSVLNRTTDIDELAQFVVFLSNLRSVSGQVFNFDSRII